MLYEQARTIGQSMDYSLSEFWTGGGSDGNLTAALGVPTLDGLGAEGGGAHALDEHILTGSLSKRAALLYHLVLRQFCMKKLTFIFCFLITCAVVSGASSRPRRKNVRL